MGESVNQKYKFRFSTTFETLDDERIYEIWINENQIKKFYHGSDRDSWPRNCNITIVATIENIEMLKKQKWFFREGHVTEDELEVQNK
jgi:hypothetical protein